MLKGSPYMLNSDHKPIARESAAKENVQPTESTEEKINIFAQSQQTSSMKPDFMEKFESKKKGQMSSATTVCTVS